MYNWGKMDSFVKKIEQDYKVPGGEVMVWKDRELLYSKTFGQRAMPAFEGRNLYWFYSMSKVYTATSMMQLYERGLVDLDQSVADFFPEVKELQLTAEDGSKLHPEHATIRNLLSMTGGLNYDADGDALQRLRAEKAFPETAEVVKAIFEAAMFCEPGTKFFYSMCHDVAGAIIEKVSGMSLADYMKINIFEPLGITTMGFFPTDEEKKKFLPQYTAETGEILPRDGENKVFIAGGFCSGGAGLYGTLADYIKLPEALSHMGLAKNGARILKEETVELLRTDQLTPLGVRSDLTDVWLDHGLEGFSYALGVRTRVEYTGNSPVGEFGWDGAAGGYILIDPENHLTLGYLQHVLSMGKAYSDIHPGLRNTLYEVIKN